MKKIFSSKFYFIKHMFDQSFIKILRPRKKVVLTFINFWKYFLTENMQLWFFLEPFLRVLSKDL